MSDFDQITPIPVYGSLIENMPEPLLPDFEALVSRPDETLDIARIALALALDEYPGLDVGPYLAWLDATAEAAADAADLATPMPERLAVLDRQLFEIQGFRGNGDDYFDPRNSYLNDVIDRRTGIPITLSVIYLEVGWRLGLPLVPVSFPAHFLVATTGSRRVFIDPYNRGARVAPAELLARLASIVGNAEHARQYLPIVTRAASRREVAMRMLRNLKGIHDRRDDLARLLVVGNRMVALDPQDAAAVRDRGHVLARLECFQAAYHDYLHYLRLAPLAADAADIRERVDRLRPIATRLN